MWEECLANPSSSGAQLWNPQFWVARNPDIKGIDDTYLSRHWRVGVCKVASPENERTLQASILPSLVYSTDSVQLVYLAASRANAIGAYYLAGVLNSLLVDFVIRLKVKLNLSLFFLETLPIPRSGSQLQRIAELSKALVWHPAYDRGLPNFGSIPTHIISDVRERAQIRAEIDALVTDLYGLPEADFAYILTTFPLLDRDQPALSGEPKSFITRDLALLELFKLRRIAPPQDVVAFFAAAGAEIGGVTGPVRDLAERVRLATELGAVAYVPSGRGTGRDDTDREDRETVED